MQDRPTALELLAAVQHFLEQELLPAQEDQRLRFRTRVAANALAILQRELRAGPELAEREVERLQKLLEGPPFTGKDWDRQARELRLELARRIRQGAADSGPWRQAVFASTLASVRAKLAISNPKFVE